jgi:proteasome lid subunit RPN8/RPN11
MEISISYEAQKMLTRKMLDRHPGNCCGFIFGKEGRPRLITRIVEVENLQSGEEITPTGIMNAIRYAEEEDIAFLGTFHSVNGHCAVPSTQELLKALPGHSILLLSFRKGKISDIRSWRLHSGGSCSEEKIVAQDTLQRIFKRT